MLKPLALFIRGHNVHMRVSFFFKHSPDLIPSKNDGKNRTKSALLLLSKKSRTATLMMLKKLDIFSWCVALGFFTSKTHLS